MFKKFPKLNAFCKGKPQKNILTIYKTIKLKAFHPFQLPPPSELKLKKLILYIYFSKKFPLTVVPPLKVILFYFLFMHYGGFPISEVICLTNDLFLYS